MHKSNPITRTSCILLCCLTTVLLLAGCDMVQMAQLPHRNADRWQTFDPNQYGIEIVRSEDGGFSYSWQRDAHMGASEIVLPYWRKWGTVIDLDNMVKGQLNGRTYPVVFDTGCDPMIILGEKIVTDNNLPVFFFKPDDKQNSGGLVLVDSLKIGDFHLTNYPCGLWEHRAEMQLLGLPLAQPEMIILPLSMMRRFSYFQYDNIRGELSFSGDSSFNPFPKSRWLSVPFRVEGLYLLADVPVEGFELTLRIDTGAGYQLKLDESIVRRMFEKRADFEKAWKKTVHLYGPYEGKTAETKFTARNLPFAGQTLSHVELIYSDQGSEDYQGVIGADLFAKTVMVLDFENSIMWIKKAKGSRFEEDA